MKYANVSFLALNWQPKASRQKSTLVVLKLRKIKIVVICDTGLVVYIRSSLPFYCDFTESYMSSLFRPCFYVHLSVIEEYVLSQFFVVHSAPHPDRSPTGDKNISLSLYIVLDFLYDPTGQSRWAPSSVWICSRFLFLREFFFFFFGHCHTLLLRGIQPVIPMIVKCSFRHLNVYWALYN